MWVFRSSVRSFALSPLDGASVREAHCEQASTAVREAHCAQATVARLVTFESLNWKYYFASNIALFMELGSLLYGIRLIAMREVSTPFGEEHRGLEKDISFPGNKY